MRRPRIQWLRLEGTDRDVVWTPGWVPDTPTLRWSLANDIRVEGIRNGWGPSYEAADGATIREGYVGEDDFGDYVEADNAGFSRDGAPLTDFQSATFADLDAPAQN